MSSSSRISINDGSVGNWYLLGISQKYSVSQAIYWSMATRPVKFLNLTGETISSHGMPEFYRLLSGFMCFLMYQVLAFLAR
jgi:hypothetical protein